MECKIIFSILIFLFAAADAQTVHIIPPPPANPSLISTFFPWLRPLISPSRTIPGLPAPVNNALSNMFPWVGPNGLQLQNIPGMQIPLQGLQNLQNIFRPAQQPAFILPPQNQDNIPIIPNNPTPNNPTVAIIAQPQPANPIPEDIPVQFSNFVIPEANPGVPNLPGSNLIAGVINEAGKDQEIPMDAVDF